MGVGERATHTHLVRKPRLRLHDRYETDCHPQNVEQQPPGIGGTTVSFIPRLPGHTFKWA